MKYLKFVALLTILLIIVLPSTVLADVETPVSTTYEQYGPRAKNFLMKFHSSDTLEFEDLEAGGIDIVEWPLTKTYYDRWTDPSLPYHNDIEVVPAGPEWGMYVLDLNNNETLPDGTHNPGGDPAFRHAIWHLIDRNYIATNIFQGMAAALWAPIAGAAPAAWKNPAVVNAHPYDLDEARRILDAAGYTINPATNKRIDPATGLDMNLKVYGRSDHPYRRDTAIWFAAQLDAVNIGYTLLLKTSSECSLEVMRNKDFFSYTGGWGLGVDVPDTLFGLYHSSMYWHPGKPPNYGHYSDPISDALLEQAEYAATVADAIPAVQQWQTRYIDPTWVPNPTLCSNLIFHAFRKRYGHWAGEEAYWDLNWSNIFNRPGVGIGGYNNFWTFMNMQPEYTDPEMYSHDMPESWTIRWGWKVATWDCLNPVYGSWVWDWAIMNWIYDTWIGINPMLTTEDKPWMAYQWDQGLWDNPDNPAFPKSTYVTLKIRDDVYWHDGVKMTMEDFRWMIGREPGDLLPTIEGRGIEYPWWYSSIADVHHVEVLDDQTIKIYYNIRSYLCLHFVGGLPLMPKHLWKPIFDDPLKDPTADLAEPTLTGNGPYKFISGTPTVGAALTRNDQYFALNPIDIRFTAWNFTKGTDKYTAMILTPTNYLIDDAVFNMTVTNEATSAVYYSGQFNIGPALTGGQYGATNYTIIIGSGIKPPIPDCTWIRFDYWIKYPEYNTKTHIIVRVHLWTFELQIVLIQSFDWNGNLRTDWPLYARFFHANTVREDVNCDGYVNIKDAVALGVAFGSAPGDLNWDARTDMYTDGHINIKDAVKLGRLFGWPNMCPA